MTVFLAVMTGVIYAIDPRAGIVAGIATAVYGLAAVAAYTYSRPVVHKELVSFATQYGQIQKRLLKELFIPYALLDGDGRILWYNEEFQKIVGKNGKRGKSVSGIFPELNRNVMPVEDNPQTTVELSYEERDFRAEIRLIDMQDDAGVNGLLEDPEFIGSLTALYLFETTEINRYIKENREQRMVAGLVYIDNYDEALENVEEVRTSLLVALIERKINKYFNAYDGIVRKLEKDRFFIVMQEKALDQIRENKFDGWRYLYGLYGICQKCHGSGACQRR